MVGDEHVQRVQRCDFSTRGLARYVCPELGRGAAGLATLPALVQNLGLCKPFFPPLCAPRGCALRRRVTRPARAMGWATWPVCRRPELPPTSLTRAAHASPDVLPTPPRTPIPSPARCVRFLLARRRCAAAQLAPRARARNLRARRVHGEMLDSNRNGRGFIIPPSPRDSGACLPPPGMPFACNAR